MCVYVFVQYIIKSFIQIKMCVCVFSYNNKVLPSPVSLFKNSEPKSSSIQYIYKKSDLNNFKCNCAHGGVQIPLGLALVHHWGRETTDLSDIFWAESSWKSKIKNKFMSQMSQMSKKLRSCQHRHDDVASGSSARACG